MSWSISMSFAVTAPAPFLFMVSTASSLLFNIKPNPLRFNKISITSSRTPSMVLYSWTTPSISTSSIALPGIEESRIRRSALPKVWPNPRSSGSTTTFEWHLSISSTCITCGVKKSDKEICILTTLSVTKSLL